MGESTAQLDANGHKRNLALRHVKIICYVRGENHWAWARPNQNKVKEKQVVVVKAVEGKGKAELRRMGVLRLVNAVCGQPNNEKLCMRELIMFIDMILNRKTT